jgi:hypothetical protein
MTIVSFAMTSSAHLEWHGDVRPNADGTHEVAVLCVERAFRQQRLGHVRQQLWFASAKNPHRGLRGIDGGRELARKPLQQQLLARVDVRLRDASQYAILEQIHDACVGESWNRHARHLAQRRLVIRRADEDRARLRQEPRPALGLLGLCPLRLERLEGEQLRGEILEDDRDMPHDAAAIENWKERALDGDAPSLVDSHLT